jgi:hypothetical protein
VKQLSRFLVLSSLSFVAFSGDPSDTLTADVPLVDVPARHLKISADADRVNRKPAIEPRVFVEDASSEAGYYYYDYADQKPQREQPLPLRLTDSGH